MSDQALETLHEMAINTNKSNRQLLSLGIAAWEC
jgi:hypothetical protein